MSRMGFTEWLRSEGLLVEYLEKTLSGRGLVVSMEWRRYCDRLSGRVDAVELYDVPTDRLAMALLLAEERDG